MIRMSVSNSITHRLCIPFLVVLLVSACAQDPSGIQRAQPSNIQQAQPGGIEGSGGTGNTGTGNTGLSMTTARAAHTATMLADGRVLIAGGYASGLQSTASAELYDPSTGTFGTTGLMGTARAEHVAARLADGKVLIAGGRTASNQYNYLVGAEIYDPASGAFTPTGNMVSSVRVASALLLADGRVFIAADSNAEIYDPSTGSFALTGPYSSSAVIVDAAVLLPNGTILVVGCAGDAAAQCSVGTTEIYDPTAGSFSPTGPRSAWNTTSTATLLTDGTVLFVEANDSVLPDDVEIYAPASGTFAHIGHTAEAHAFSTATRLADGTVLIAGGQLVGGNGSSAVEVYEPASRSFILAPPLIVPRHGHTATMLPDGTVLIAGGFSVWPSPTASAEVYR